ncbi:MULTISPECIES: helix-turn-helix transcriptional regulator [unclassified Crossiella]|uniref:helix-turn-helix domain-containing protein n=1 Tax=unclassified Crossiella TaxID=2620835 RepID=UPI001FFF9B4F|nr:MULTISPECIES: helix-turn-helix transcriptional regulator [unclassified Crossiella]MCK2244019.1 helix-turn-helix domain-containing protein [Crossiella sp. S99.2]MCK2257123.1 helix-turn-helix domain-containing protein [Crossiella sp. S99.1]
MTAGGSPVAYQRRLRSELRRAREAAGVTQKAVAEGLDWSPSKVIRIETGAVGISTTDLKALLAFYEVKDEAVVELVEIAKASRKQVWWDKHRPHFRPAFFFLIGLESSASVTRQFQSLLVPGLLQIEEYAREIIGLYDRDNPDIIERAVRVRMERQERFFENGARIFYVLDEAVLRRAVGGKEVMRKQLLKLKEMNRLPQVRIQVVGFDKGAHVGMKGSFIVYEFDEEGQDHAIYLESSSGDTLIIQNNPEENSKYVELFVELETLASAEGELDEIIDRVIAESFS